MIKKLFLTLLLCFIPLTIFADDPASWDLIDEPCNDYTTVITWIDNDGGNGVSEISPAGQFHHYISSAASGSYAYRYGDLGSYPQTFTTEIELYHDTLGTQGLDNFRFQMRTANIAVIIEFATDGLFVYDGASWNEVGTNLVSQDTWQTWRFLIDDSDDTMDVYLDDSLVGSDVDVSYTGTFTDGQIFVIQYGLTVATESHIDYIKIATGLYDPTVAAAAQVISVTGSW